MNRQEHVAWAKNRALEYVDRGDLQSAVASMITDMQKGPEPHSPIALQLGVLELTMPGCGADRIRHWIEGFS